MVFSCFDEQNWPKLKPPQGTVNIGCYHGPVLGSLTDIEWELDSEIDTSFFDKYDFAFLGDIHKMQFVDGNKRIAYPGSFIQQDFGETPGKGFLYWQINDREDFEVDFYSVEHDHPFITAHWLGSVQETIDKAAITEGARVRIRSSNHIDQVSWMHLKSALKEQYNIHELVHDLKKIENKPYIESDFQKNINFRDKKVLNSYFSKWIENNFVTKNDQSKVLDYLEKIISKIPEVEKRRNSKWSINNLKFNNLFSYGEDNEINFNTLKGVVGIFGKNRSGKSSIPGALMYGLFNTSDRGTLKNLHIINARKNYCSTQITFSVNSKFYLLERQTTKNVARTGRVSAATHLNLFELDESGNTIRDLSLEQRRNTEKLVRELIGTSEDFLMTSFASQGEMNTFIKEKATSRKSILASFLDLDVFEQMNLAARKDLLELKGKLSEAPQRDWTTIKQEKDLEIKKIKKDLEENSRILEEKRGDLRKIDSFLATVPDGIITEFDVNNQRRKVTAEEGELSVLVLERKNLQKKWLERKEQYCSLENILNSENENFLCQQLQNASKINKKIEDLKRECGELKRKKKEYFESSIILKEVPCGTTFPNCKFITKAHRSYELIQGIEEQMGQMNSLIENFSDSYELINVDLIEEKIKKIKMLKEKLKLLERNIEGETRLIKIIGEKLELKKEKVDLEKLKLEDMNNKSSSKDPEDINTLKTARAELEKEIATIDSTRLSSNQIIGRIKSELEKTKKDEKRFLELSKEWQIIDIFVKASSKNGIPLDILTSKLPLINLEIAEILQGTTGFTVELVADSNSNAMDIFINYGDSKRIIECASGMEKMLSSLAIRVALMNLSSLPKSDILIIDEGFGALDASNVEACNALLQNLKKWFKSILVISHVDAVKDSVDNIIEISKRGKDSHVDKEN